MTALYFASCQIVNLWWTVGRVRRQYCCGAQHWFADIWRQVFSMLDKKFGSRWRVQKVAAHQSRAEVDSGCLSRHAWSGNSKADEMARSGATRYAVAPGDVYAHGAAWDKATDLAHFLTEAALYICSSAEGSADTKSADELEVCNVVPVVRARLQVTFHEIAWTIDRWRCSRCQRYAHNKLTLAACTRTACVPLYGAARGDAPSIPRVHPSHRIRRSGPITWCTICGACSSNRSFALRQCCPGTCPSDTRS